MTLNEIIMQLVLLEEHPAMPKGFQPTFQKVIEAISEMPEIIRCKDCRYWARNTQFCGVFSSLNIAQRMPEDGFCSYGGL